MTLRKIHDYLYNSPYFRIIFILVVTYVAYACFYDNKPLQNLTTVTSVFLLIKIIAIELTKAFNDVKESNEKATLSSKDLYALYQLQQNLLENMLHARNKMTNDEFTNQYDRGYASGMHDSYSISARLLDEELSTIRKRWL